MHRVEGIRQLFVVRAVSSVMACRWLFGEARVYMATPQERDLSATTFVSPITRNNVCWGEMTVAHWRVASRIDILNCFSRFSDCSCCCFDVTYWKEFLAGGMCSYFVAPESVARVQYVNKAASGAPRGKAAMNGAEKWLRPYSATRAMSYETLRTSHRNLNFAPIGREKPHFFPPLEWQLLPANCNIVDFRFWI